MAWSRFLEELMDYAHETGVLPEDSVTYRDLFDTRLMNCLMPRPSEVVDKFWRHYENSPVEAMDYFYKLSQDSITSVDTVSART